MLLIVSIILTKLTCLFSVIHQKFRSMIDKFIKKRHVTLVTFLFVFFDRLLILDEMDQLDSKNQEVLYMMFSWIGNTNSHLILIGIANSLNLTDRMLPRLVHSSIQL